MLSALSNYIVPSFLQRFDRYLLVNHPHLWRTRGHYFSFYTFIAAILMFLAGYFYPQNLYDLVEDANWYKTLPLYVTIVWIFATIAIIFGGWYFVQKFKYDRVQWNHFLAEIGIYAVCLSLLWATVFGFLIGYQYRMGYRLTKNIEPNIQWLKENQFFKSTYVPHYQLDKLDNLNAYFKQGDSLMFHLQKRLSNLKSTGVFNKGNAEDYYAYEEFEYYEYLTPPAYKLIPAPYTSAAKYYEDVFLQKIGLDPNKQPYFRDSENLINNPAFAAKTLPYLTAPVYHDLIEQIHPNWYRYIDISKNHQGIWNKLFEKWAVQKTFLDQLSPLEQKSYLEYLKYLRIKMPMNTQLISFTEKTAFEYLTKKVKGTHWEEIGLGVISDEAYQTTMATYDATQAATNELNPDDPYFLAAEQALLFIKSLSPRNKKRYAMHIQRDFAPIRYTHHNEGVAATKKKSLDYLRKKFPKATLQDSIIHFDTYFSDFATDFTPIFQQAYAEYFVGKYSAANLKRLENILQVNGFPTKNLDWGASQQNLFLLRQGAVLEKALDDLPFKQRTFREMRLSLYGLFSVICCILAGIVFYIATLSNGIQFWAGIFAGAFGMIFITFLLNMSGLREKQIFTILISLHLILFIGLILTLFFSKYQWRYVKQVVNSILFSGVLSILFASLLIASYFNDMKRLVANYKYENRIYEDIFIFTNVVLVAIFIYLIITYLFKRHLTLPKKH